MELAEAALAAVRSTYFAAANYSILCCAVAAPFAPHDCLVLLLPLPRRCEVCRELVPAEYDVEQQYKDKVRCPETIWGVELRVDDAMCAAWSLVAHWCDQQFG